jgi:hypothetical protein
MDVSTEFQRTLQFHFESWFYLMLFEAATKGMALLMRQDCPCERLLNQG